MRIGVGHRYPRRMTGPGPGPDEPVPTAVASDGEPSPLATRRVAGDRRLLGALLSFVWAPGAGHLLIGRTRRAWIWFAIGWVSLFAFALVGALGLVGALVLRLVIIADLFWLRVSPASLPPMKAVLVGMGLMLAIGFGGSGIMRTYVAEAFTIPSGGMLPTVEIGDHIMVNKLVSPSKGDVAVFTNPCDGKTFIKRIVATAGDRVEIRCDMLYVNGVPTRSDAAGRSCKLIEVDPEYNTNQHYTVTCFTETVGDTTFQVAEEPDRESSFPRHEQDIPGCGTRSESTAPTQNGTVAASDPGQATGRCAPTWHYVVPEGHVFGMGDNRDNSNDSRVWGPIPIGNLLGRAEYIWWTRDGLSSPRIGSSVD